MDLGLHGRVCVVTGASGGIGSATAHALAAEGASLLLVGRRRRALDELASSCLEGGAGEVSALDLDLTAADAAGHVIEAATEGLGGLDVLINNAGTTQARPLDSLPDEAWQEQWDLHVMAPMRLMRAAAPVMAEAGWGRVVNVCSSSGKRPSGSLDMAYSVTKAGQLSLSRAFAERFAAQGVLINAVAPGPVAGTMWEAEGGLADQLASEAGPSRQDVLAATAARLPIGRFATAEEIADVIVFLCSERASDVAGVAWSVDGGAVPGII